MAKAIAEFVAKDRQDPAVIAEFDRLDYVSIDASKGEDGWHQLKEMMRPDVVRAFYFSVAPALFGELAEKLHSHEIANSDSRIVVEKPFGRDLGSARALNTVLASHFEERQIYRIDHYLGKETVQNLMAVRFANILFEPLWNSQFIDHVQITVAETVGVEGRGSYYDKSGAMRDVVQNHLMQLLCLIAMEPPYHFDPNAVRDEKLNYPCVATCSCRRHRAGSVSAVPGAPGYLEDSENPDSRTESYIALKVHIASLALEGHALLSADRQETAGACL